MTKKIIKDGKKIIAIILKKGEYPKGLQFYNSETDFLQLATWNYPQSEEVKPHIHVKNKKIALQTQEFFFLVEGSLRAEIFNNQGKKITSTILKKGDAALFLSGGHGFKMLENKTQVLMLKNGPYTGKINDKKLIEDIKK